MGLADPGRPQDDHIVGQLDEAGGGQFLDLAAIEGGLEVEIVLLQGLEPGEAGQAQAGLDAALLAALPLDGQGPGQEGRVVQVLAGGLFADAGDLGFQVLQLELAQEGGQFHVATSWYTARGRRCTWSVSCQSGA